MRWWEITIEKTVVEGDDLYRPVTCVMRVQAPTAQEATKQLVDLTTNNSRVFRFEVNEIEDE